MIRVLVVFLVVAIARFVIASLVGWLAYRERASKLHVACVVNTVILFAIVDTLGEFRNRGLAISSLCYALLMFWLTYGAVRSANVAFVVIDQNRLR